MNRSKVTLRLARGVVVLMGAVALAPIARATDAVPDFSGIYIHNRTSRGDPVPPGGWPKGFNGTIGPIRGLPRPGSLQSEQGNRAGNYNDPILKPWAAAIVKKLGDADEEATLSPRNPALCKPFGPLYLLGHDGTTRVVQTRTKIVLLYDQDYQSRTIYLNAAHPAHLTPSWNGHSVGHFEGQTLVVDTIGTNDKTEVDTFGTPHSEQMHLIERFTLFDNGKALADDFVVDDPAAYNKSWTGIVTMARTDTANPEYVCAENNRFR